MLECCFRHLPGVGPAFEGKLRDAGVLTWNDALLRPLPCGAARAQALRKGIEESRNRLAGNDAFWFGQALAPAEQWRLFPHFRGAAAYVDIETTGLSWPEGGITSIALFDGAGVRTYVQGVNLEDFADDILAYTLLVTWNGRGFDVPFLRKTLHIPLDKSMAHLDLLPVYRALGLKGGLKRVERSLGLDRGDLEGVDGWAAVRLWKEYERSDDPRVLETLLAYNVADVLSLEVLAEHAVALHACAARGESCPPPDPDRVRRSLNPHRPDKGVLRRVLGLYGK